MTTPDSTPRDHGFHRGVQPPGGPELSDGQRRGSALGPFTGDWFKEMMRIEKGAPAVTLPALVLIALGFQYDFISLPNLES